MLHGVAVRERTCPACATTVRERSARWCGTCGAMLDAADAVAATASSDGPPWRRRLLSAAAGATVIALLVAAGDGLIDRAAAGSTDVADDAVAAPSDGTRSRIERRPPLARPRTTEPTCAGVLGLDCFAWTAELPLRHSAGVLVTRQVLVSTDPVARTLTARRTSDGEVLWTSESGDGSVGFGLVGAGDLVLQPTADALLAWDLHTGDRRWTAPTVSGLDVYGVVEVDGTLLITGSDAGDVDDVTVEGEDGDVAWRTQGVAVALDVVSGEERWRRRGANASLAADGSVVLHDPAGTTERLGPDGTARWRLEYGNDQDGGIGGAYAVGHAVVVHGEHVAERLVSLSDGRDLGLVDVYDLASDATATLVSGRAAPGERVLALLDGDGERWRVPEEVVLGQCGVAPRLLPETVEFTNCDGEQVVLDRADGRERSRTSGTAPPPFEEGLLDVIGPYAVTQSDPNTWTGDVVVTEIETGNLVARLPADTWPLATREGAIWSSELDGVVVLQSPGWLAALPLPDGPAPLPRAAR